LGQCIAEMVAAQKFNEANDQPIATIYGSISSGTAWRFLQLEGRTCNSRSHRLPTSSSRANFGNAGVDGAGGIGALAQA
jgi:hypothetical protein